jgi:hypothetical protein
MARMSPLSRRDWLKLSSAGVIGWSLSGWLETLAAQAADDPKRKRSVILLWMSGGPSQMDTFDLKPGHANGGPFKEIKTTAAEMRISEHLPRLAQQARHLALIRSMSTREGDHTRATHYLRTGYLPQGPIRYPTLGSLLSKELGDEDASLPNFVSIAPMTYISPAAFSPGFLGARYAPLMVAGNDFTGGANYEKSLKVQDLTPADVGEKQTNSRLEMLRGLQDKFAHSHQGLATAGHVAAYDHAVRLMQTKARTAFDLHQEKQALRDAYGRNLFGQGCLLARRLIERGVPFVEVSLARLPGNGIGWDTHQNNFDQVKNLCQVLDPAWATLMSDLKDRGLLDSTLVVWMGEFGRTPRINGNNGRDHFPTAWTAVLGGGGIKGGQVYGKTSKDGMKVEEKPVIVKDFLATVCQAVGVDHTKQNLSNVGRPIRIADAGAEPLKEVLA